ncbi:MAG: ribonuclease P protein component [Woeseia sp.]
MSRESRLPDTGSFRRVFKKAMKSRDALFTVVSRANDNKGARLGLAISRKNCRLAARRNRLKRVVRESFRMHRANLHGLDVVVMSQPAASSAPNAKLFDSLALHWQRCRSGLTESARDGNGPNG